MARKRSRDSGEQTKAEPKVLAASARTCSCSLSHTHCTLERSTQTRETRKSKVKVEPAIEPAKIESPVLAASARTVHLLTLTERYWSTLSRVRLPLSHTRFLKQHATRRTQRPFVEFVKTYKTALDVCNALSSNKYKFELGDGAIGTIIEATHDAPWKKATVLNGYTLTLRMDEKGTKFNSEDERWNRCSGKFVTDGAVLGGA